MSLVELLRKAAEESIPVDAAVDVRAGEVVVRAGGVFVARGVHADTEKAAEACARAFLKTATPGRWVDALRDRVGD